MLTDRWGRAFGRLTHAIANLMTGYRKPPLAALTQINGLGRVDVDQ
jgi:hypothetical protein